MKDQQLKNYIKQQLVKKINKRQIKASLTSKGWSEQDINKAFDSLKSALPLSNHNFLTTLNSHFIVIFLGLILLLSLIVSGILYFQWNRQKHSINTTPQHAKQSLTLTNSLLNFTINTKTRCLINNKYEDCDGEKYIFQYPSTWKIYRLEKGLHNPQNEKEEVIKEAIIHPVFDHLYISHNEYIIEFFMPPSGGDCIYEGQPEIEGSPTTRFYDYAELRTSDGSILRRSLSKTTDNKKIVFVFCSKVEEPKVDIERNDSSSNTKIDYRIFPLLYHLPIEYDQKILAEMDKITSSFQIIR